MLEQAHIELENKSLENIYQLITVCEIAEELAESLCMRACSDWLPEEFAKASSLCFILRGLSESVMGDFSQYSRLANSRPAPKLVGNRV